VSYAIGLGGLVVAALALYLTHRARIASHRVALYSRQTRPVPGARDRRGRSSFSPGWPITAPRRLIALPPWRRPLWPSAR